MFQRIVAIDFGKKRCGVAMTDPMGWFAQAVGVFSPEETIDWLKKCQETDNIEKIIIGMPLLADGSIGETGNLVVEFAEEIQKNFPKVPIDFIDERNSSQNAMQSLIESGVKKQKRKEKGMLDKATAVLLLQNYLAEQ
jgi:putative holliday junction resolvase